MAQSFCHRGPSPSLFVKWCCAAAVCGFTLVAAKCFAITNGSQGTGKPTAELRQPKHFAATGQGNPSGNQQSRTASRFAKSTAINVPRSGKAVEPVAYAQDIENAAEAAREEAEFDAEIARNSCAAMPTKSLGQLGISIAMPSGEFPADEAGACWTMINQSAGPTAGMRMWGTSTFAWNATCLCYRPLYFEQPNLERYGYGCGCGDCGCLQSAASAAHFFATIPALPYCIATNCPGDCDYTLGQYRPGSCPPYRCQWPK